jgi:transcriptional regulator with XRE-family HTH domain
MSSEILKLFAERLKQLREEKKLTQEELAFRAEVDRTYIARLETMKRNPSLVSLQKIADGFEMPLIKLLDFNE